MSSIARSVLVLSGRMARPYCLGTSTETIAPTDEEGRHMPRFDIGTYDTVDARLTRFWEEHPNGAIHTELVTDGNAITTFLAIRASVWFDRADPIPAGQGIAYGQADPGGRSVDSTSWVENCDTSAVGRALANAGYKAKKDSHRPSREEMEVADSREPRRLNPDERATVEAQHQRNTAPAPSSLPVTRSAPASQKAGVPPLAPGTREITPTQAFGFDPDKRTPQAPDGQDEGRARVIEKCAAKGVKVPPDAEYGQIAEMVNHALYEAGVGVEVKTDAKGNVTPGAILNALLALPVAVTA